MATNELDRLFESLLEETDGVENLELTLTRVVLTAALTRVHPAMSAKPNGTEAVTPDTCVDDIYEQDAAQHFLDRLSSDAMPVPADLIAAVIADGVREPKPVSARRGWKILPLTNRWGWAAGATGVLVLALLGFRISEQVVAPGVIAPPADAVANLQAPYRANMDVTSPPPPRPRPENSDARIDGRNFNEVVTPPPPKSPGSNGVTTKPVAPIYTAPNPPIALTSHAVTAEDYPPDSVRLQEQGAVKVKYTIRTDGTVGDCTVTMTSGFLRLDEAACVLVRKWIFKPAMVIGGAPVAVSIPAEIIFALK